jgi:hypothetical protein
MPQHLALAWRDHAGRLRSIPFWMAQAPVFFVAFAALGLAARKQWIPFVIVVTCVWVYARVLRHEYFVELFDRAFTQAVLAVDRRIPRWPKAETRGVADDLPAPIAEAPIEVPPAPLVEPAPPRRAPRRVRPVEVSPVKRLLQLEELRETGLVTPAEYQDKRQEILRAI